ncbi:DUF4232 domain-containing protein [Streptomyces iconiensis]|uniref:DUF4232 domain-containing protein n=1 Tax=Streptomyces iconiensis TaxID=1384038 RepID=A0ABT7A3C8_9ACTN|nr:DUF4232 domain-containing protein [Streptomyces iconiensis]MDJ1135832.1 DUF4232 domain-containing protein [Streptomyces iconiensis]
MTTKFSRLVRGSATVLAVAAVGVGATAATASAAGSGTGTGTAKAKKSVSRCHTGELTAGWGSEGGGRPDMDSVEQQTVTMSLKNSSKRTCTLHGFPGVSMENTLDAKHPMDLRRSASKPVTVTLKPGTHTSFTMRILPVPKGQTGVKKVAPGRVLVTPPDEKAHFTLKWPYGGAIQDQSGATHPGTFVNPIGVG